MATVWTAPDAAPTDGGHFVRPSLFLAGSIEQGAADKWQDELASRLAAHDGIFLLNPRRESWDANVSAAELARQIEWELDSMEKCHAIFMYLQPGTISPVSLLELGIYVGLAHSGMFLNKIVVCCPDGFHRKTNVEVTCARVGIPVLDDFDEALCEALAMMYRNAAAFSPATDVPLEQRVGCGDV